MIIVLIIKLIVSIAILLTPQMISAYLGIQEDFVNHATSIIQDSMVVTVSLKIINAKNAKSKKIHLNNLFLMFSILLFQLNYFLE